MNVRTIVTTLHLLGQKSAAPLSFAIGWELSNRGGWRFPNNRDSSRRLQNDPDIKGPQPLIGSKKIREMERILETKGIEARAYTWE